MIRTCQKDALMNVSLWVTFHFIHAHDSDVVFVFCVQLSYNVFFIIWLFDSMPCYSKCFTLAEFLGTWEAEFIFPKHIYRGRTEGSSSKRWEFFSDSYGSINRIYGNSKRVLLYWSCWVSYHRTHYTCKNSPTGNNSYLHIFFFNNIIQFSMHSSIPPKIPMEGNFVHF